jgi:hypothetical protein
MQPLRIIPGCLLICLLAGGWARAQTIYFNTSSSVLSANTLDSVATNGAGKSTLLAATGVDFNKISRCTAVAVDNLNSRLFLIDGETYDLWSLNLDGTGPTLVKGGLTNYPTDLALDVLNEKIYYTTSSTIQGNNTVQRVDYTGSNNVTLFLATSNAPGGNGVWRCTALAVDSLNAKLFIADAGARKIWSLSLNGTGAMALASTTNCVPTDLALDPANQQVYFTASSPVQSSNHIQRVTYSGTGLTTLFTAAGSVQRCTALDLDPAHATLYLSDAGSNAPALWRIPLAGGSATSVLSGLAATAKKVRWFSGPTTRPAPSLTGVTLAGSSVVLTATNGLVGGTYYVLTSTNLDLPLSQWLLLSTNVLGASGSFSLTATNPVAAVPRRFFLLRVQ